MAARTVLTKTCFPPSASYDGERPMSRRPVARGKNEGGNRNREESNRAARHWAFSVVRGRGGETGFRQNCPRCHCRNPRRVVNSEIVSRFRGFVTPSGPRPTACGRRSVSPAPTPQPPQNRSRFGAV